MGEYSAVCRVGGSRKCVCLSMGIAPQEEVVQERWFLQELVISVLRREKYLGRLLTRGRQKFAFEASKKAFNGILRNKRSA